MSANRLPVVAVVPNYNMGEGLEQALPKLLEQDYDDVYVLDDASTDHSADVLSHYSPDIHVVRGSENIGAAANRNRIIPALSHHALIHFIDADFDLTSEQPASTIRDSIGSSTVGFLGGLVTDREGVQLALNYGPRQSLYADIGAMVQTKVDSLRPSDPGKAQALRQRFSRLLEQWPNQFESPVARRVFWAIEQNLVVDSRIFAGMGGYDDKLREHEIQDLAIRMHKLGLERRFDPALAGVHKSLQVRDYYRPANMIKAELYIARKHGLLNWLLPDGQFRPE